jgi:3-hydroxyacyl-CoA dehydrogenase / 3-hydroxy-2-methylbutyryl-CoA dehydrogenase
MDIKGKTAFVAGGTSGLGLAVARELSARGANLVIVGRRGALADQIAAELGNAIGVGADIASSQAISAGVSAAIKRFGSIHINVNTAGVIAALSLVDSDGRPGDLAEFARLINTNVVGTFNDVFSATLT